jgi:hypothetical protein
MIKILTRVGLGLVLYIIGCAIPPSVFAASYYASPTGSGSTCSTTSPCSLSTGLGIVSAGDTLYLRGGTYSQTIDITKSGTASSPIVISGYQGETAVIDGGGSMGEYSPLFYIHGSYVHLKNIELTRGGMGLVITGNYDIASYINSHNHISNGILISGSSNGSIVEDSIVHDNCEYNKNGAGGHWASGLTAARKPNGAIIRRNTVYQNWGEGVSSYEATNTTIEDNIIHDNYSVNIYLSDTTGVVAQRNFVYRTGSLGSGGGVEAGIALGDEVCNPESSNNKVLNNIVWGANRNIEYWGNANCNTHGLLNVVIANNTMVDSISNDGNLFISNGGGNANTIIQNNLVYQSDSKPVCFFSSKTGLTLGYNLWSKGCTSGSGSNDITGDPMLAKTGAKTDPAWFKLSGNSPAIDKATVLSDIPVDFFKSPRGSSPDIGAHEYGGAPPGTPMPTPTPGSTTLTPTPTRTPTPGGNATRTPTPSPARTPTPNATLSVKPGDANGDNAVDEADYGIWLAHFGQTVNGGKTVGDFDGNGAVDGVDYVLWLNNFGK